jgi:ABC-2 type transport system ATP-binding protein
VVSGARLTCEVDAQALDALLQALGRVGVVSLTSQPPTLEELFLRHYASVDGGDRAATP